MKTSADYEAIFAAAKDAESELLVLGRKFLSRTEGASVTDAEIEEDPYEGRMGSWRFDWGGVRTGFSLTYVPTWHERDDDDEVFKIPSRVIDDFDGAVADALEEARRKEEENTRKAAAEAVAEALAEEEAERLTYERLKKKFEGDAQEV